MSSWLAYLFWVFFLSCFNTPTRDNVGCFSNYSPHTDCYHFRSRDLDSGSTGSMFACLRRGRPLLRNSMAEQSHSPLHCQEKGVGNAQQVRAHTAKPDPLSSISEPTPCKKRTSPWKLSSDLNFHAVACSHIQNGVWWWRTVSVEELLAASMRTGIWVSSMHGKDKWMWKRPVISALGRRQGIQGQTCYLN